MTWHSAHGSITTTEHISTIRPTDCSVVGMGYQRGKKKKERKKELSEGLGGVARLWMRVILHVLSSYHTFVCADLNTTLSESLDKKKKENKTGVGTKKADRQSAIQSKLAGNS